jgi:hypothetical protein
VTILFRTGSANEEKKNILFARFLGTNSRASVLPVRQRLATSRAPTRGAKNFSRAKKNAGGGAS